MEDIVTKLQEWASTNPSILVQFSLLKVSEGCLESNCGIAGMVTSLDPPTLSMTNQNSNIVEVIVAGVVVTVSVIVISSVILLIFIIAVKHRSKKNKEEKLK